MLYLFKKKKSKNIARPKQNFSNADASGDTLQR